MYKLTVGTRPSLEQFLALLRGSPNLEGLLMSGDIVDNLRTAFEILGNAPEPVLLSSLRRLTITEFETSSSVNHTIRLLNTPKLVELGVTDLCFDREGDPVDFTPTFDLLSTMFPTIEKLQIAYVSCASPESLERWFCSLNGAALFVPPVASTKTRTLLLPVRWFVSKTPGEI